MDRQQSARSPGLSGTCPAQHGPRPPQEALWQCVADLQVPEPQPVDVSLDEQLFTHARVIGRVCAGHYDDGVDGRIRGVLLPIHQHTIDDARLVAV